MLAPEGRAILIAPSRRGVWARVDGTPFGQGQPYLQVAVARTDPRNLVLAGLLGRGALRAAVQSRFFVNSAPALERVGSALGLPFAGVHIIEAIKQVYRPVGVHRVARDAAAALRPGARARARRERATRCASRLPWRAERAFCAADSCK